MGGTFFLGKQAGISLGGPIVHIDEMTDQIQKLADSEELATEVKEMHSEFRERLADHSARLQNIEREVEYKRVDTRS